MLLNIQGYDFKMKEKPRASISNSFQLVESVRHKQIEALISTYT